MRSTGLPELPDHEIGREPAHELEHVAQARANFQAFALESIDRVAHQGFDVHRPHADVGRAQATSSFFIVSRSVFRIVSCFL
jgi:hypothetical protein